MARTPYVIAGTVVGVAAVLAYPTSRPHLEIPSASGVTGASTPGPTTSSPTTAAPSGSAPAPNTAAPSTAAPNSSASTRQATGAQEQYRYGELSVTVTVTGSRITGVSLAQLQDDGGQSQFIDQQAIPLLSQQVLAAQSANIDGVSGATYTSQAYVDSVQSALDQLGVK